MEKVKLQTSWKLEPCYKQTEAQLPINQKDTGLVLLLHLHLSTMLVNCLIALVTEVTEQDLIVPQTRLTPGSTFLSWELRLWLWLWLVCSDLGNGVMGL